MTDAVAPEPGARPRPQYGEYATPEEQRARIRQPDVTAALETGRPVEVPPAVAAPVGPAATETAGADVPPAADAALTRRRAVDRIVTFALLAYGLVNVISSYPAFLDYSAYADTMFTVLGVEAELADPAAGRPWGIAAALLLTVGWIATAAISWWNMSRRRLSWWIPLVAGVVFVFVAGMLMVVPLMNDPAAWDALVGSLG
ncbi:DUF6264 family protein [Microbacterium sp. HD4P20]|uniref:DUF6264 family protein n=1 Tax=Microbacterium sp. HD4P20 TaxID=2864874 RepID=UPI001C63E439|nr:DUF6264 family protein [Microbacterium sp. HD4P20]MCP2637841.1 DUF6264 family protein [Microbacterium sp. HD4P20]